MNIKVLFQSFRVPPLWNPKFTGSSIPISRIIQDVEEIGCSWAMFRGRQETLVVVTCVTIGQGSCQVEEAGLLCLVSQGSFKMADKQEEEKTSVADTKAQSVGGIWEDSKEGLTIGLKNVLIYIRAAGEGKWSLSTTLLSLPVCVDFVGLEKAYDLVPL